MDNNTNHLLDVLNLINNLQKSQLPSVDNTSCTRPILGNVPTLLNTRPVQFYSCNNTLLTVNYYVNNVLNTADTFRVENVGNSTVTVRLLAQEEDNYVSTDEFATININCICAIRCLNDININL